MNPFAPIRSGLLAAALLGAAVGGALAADPACHAVSGARRAGVVELYTSEGCSSCPPADHWLSGLKGRDDVVALAFHVDYWDNLGWKDRFASPAYTARQAEWRARLKARFVYTPQVIVNGAAHVIGSDRARIEGAIHDTGKTSAVMSVPVTMTLSGRQLTVSVAAGKETTPAQGEVWLCSISKSVPISISRGENRGREIVYHNVVRNLLKVGEWNGSAESWTVPLDSVMRDGIDAAAVLVQDGSRDKPGPMLGAAFTPLH